ncbi:MAG: succinate dehydrogenase/fumarate reductase transmembrane subunit [Planctomycetota bacterium]
MTSKESFFQRHHFLLRRLHSLTGILPIGFFLISHMTTNSSIVWGMLNSSKFEGLHAGAATFQHEVNFIHSLPFLLLIEIFGLWLPIAFHSILGVYYAMGGSSNVHQYAYRDNWRYSLQRISGYVGVLFIFYHIATLRWGWTFLVPGGTEWSAEFAASTMAAAMQGSTEGFTGLGFVVAAGYMLGVSLLVFHLANGVWTAAITWGLTVTEAAQKRWGYVCSVLGVGLMGLAWSAVIGFATLDYQEAYEAELHLQGAHSPESASGGEDVLFTNSPSQSETESQ